MQEIIKYVGASDDLAQIQLMQAEGEKFIQSIKEARANPKVPEHTISINTAEVARKNVGIRDVLGGLYDKLGFNSILGSKKLNDVLKSVVLTRFAEPSSKRKATYILERRFNEPLSLDPIYYMMDNLTEKLDKSQQTVFKATKEIVGSSIDLALFDVTTLHLETVAQDELRDFGYSKNNRVDCTQVVLALATTTEGLPIGYKLFPGNTAEAKTLMMCINKWKKIIAINDIIVVGDRAMMSESNLQQLRENGLKYIIAYPLKKAKATLKDSILNKQDYQATLIEHKSYLKKELALENGDRLIVTFNEKRRAKDEKDREKLISKLRNKLSKTKDAKKLISNRGYLKFTEISDKTIAEINEKKIALDAQWDGLHGVITNAELQSDAIITRYKKLWIIEEAFRINKHNLKMRPIFHSPQIE